MMVLPPFAILLGTSLRGQQQYVWTTSPQGPPARFAHAAAWSTLGSYVLLHGGYAPGYATRADTWRWNGSTWTPMLSSTYPSARAGHQLVYLESVQRFLMFGGADGLGGVLGDSWQWDGTTWTNLNPSSAPTARHVHAMAYDSARQVVVLYGGSAGQQPFLSDTWEWNGSTWSNVVASSPPGALAGASMAYEPMRQRTIMFGGTDGINYPSTTWEWDGQAWSQLVTANAPLGRTGHQLAPWPATGFIAMFGGQDSSSVMGDTWFFDGSTWLNPTTSSSPWPMLGASLTRSPNGTLLLYGGYDGQSIYSNAHQLEAVATPLWPAVATSYGQGCQYSSISAQPDPAHRPITGTNAQILISDPPTLVAAATMGWSDQSFGPFQLPIDLDAIGMGGCNLLTSAEVPAIPCSMTPSGALACQYPIPNDVTLLGAIVFLQAYALAPGANPLQVVVSNGVRWQIGDQ
jgi:hypothetical protein